MKQVFEETSRTTAWQRFRGLLSGGGVQVIVGSSLITLIVLAGILGTIFTERFNAGRLAERYQPPHNRLLQRLLYHPATRVDTVRQEGGTDPFQLGTVSMTAEPQEDGSPETVPTIASEPLYTAATGQAYHYDIRVRGGEASTYTLGRSPSGMRIDASSGRIEWTPQASHVGASTVEVRALNEDGRGTKQTYEIHVAETPHPLGTENRGRGMGAALLLGAQWAVLPGCIAVFVSMILGILFGGLAGYYEQTTDALLTYLSNLTEALPALVLLFLAAVIFQYNIFLIMGVVGLIWFPRVANAIKAKVQSLKARQFVEAARELGLRDREILWRDIIWYNARPQLLLQASYGFVFAIIVEVTLSYLQLGIKPPTISWGNLLFEGKSQMINHAYWPILLPAFAIIVSVAAFYLLADGIRRRYDLSRT